MKRAATACCNLVLPGSAQVALGHLALGVALAAVFGVALAAALVNRWVVPGILAAHAGVFWMAAVTAWAASQVLMVVGIRRAQRSVDDTVTEALRGIARLWLCDRGEEALALCERVLHRRPHAPELHYVAAVLLSEAPGNAADRVRLHLDVAQGCDESGRWQEAIERERDRLADRSRPQV